MNPKIAIIGAGALGIQIANICKRNDIDVIGFFDDTKTVNTSIAGIPILGRIDDIYIYIYAFTHLVIGVGYNHFAFRESLYNKFSKIKPFLTIVDKTAIIDPTARLGEGSIVMPGVILDMNVVVKENVFINIGSVIAHNSTINAHSFIAPSVAIAGFTSIGKKSFIGINSSIIDGLKLPDNIEVGAGTVIINNLDGAGLYVGNPAHKIR